MLYITCYIYNISCLAALRIMNKQTSQVFHVRGHSTIVGLVMYMCQNVYYSYRSAMHLTIYYTATFIFNILLLYVSKVISMILEITIA